MSLFDNAINKRLSDYSYIASIESKKKKVSNKPQKIIKGKLLNKIVESNLNENAITKRLEQISYSNIDGQRQEAKNYAPEGVQMLGQLDREKPLTAITKEMIKEFQENEVTPIMVDGEARQYRPADYDPNLVSSPEEMESRVNRLNEWLKELQDERGDISNKIAVVDDKIKTTNESIISSQKDINENIFSFSSYYKLQQKKRELDKLKEERKQLDSSLDKVRYDISNYEDAIKRVRYDTTDREEIKRYEQSLMQQNRNRLNLQQQPYESDYEYYKRLREVEKTKFNPVLYRQYAVNQNIKELKSKMTDLFNDTSFIESVIKKLPDENKFLINKNFNQIKTNFIQDYGFNPSMSVNMAVDNINSELNKLSATNIQRFVRGNLGRQQANMQRQIQTDEAAENLQRFVRGNLGRQQAQEQIAQEAIRRNQQDLNAARNLQRFARGNLGRKQIQEQILQTRREKEQQSQAEQAERYAEREARQLALAQQREQRQIDKQIKESIRNQSALDIQRVFRGKLGKKEAAQVAAQAARQKAAQVAEQKYAERLARAQSYSNTLAQIQAQEQAQELMQRIAQTQALSKNLKQENKAAQLERQSSEQSQEFPPSYALERQPLTFEARTGRNELSMVGLKERQAGERKMMDEAERQRIQEIQKTRRAAPIIQRFFKTNKDKIQSKKAEILAQQAKAAPIIQQFFQTTKNKVELMNAIAKKIEKLEEQKSEKLKAEKARKAQELLQQYTETPAATELSGAMTVAEQKESQLRKVRSDLGSKRGPYKKKSLTPEQRRTVQQPDKQIMTRSQALNAVLQRQQPGRNRTLDQINEEVDQLLDYRDTQGAAGSGFVRRPKKRVVKIPQQDKMKNRLRLVVSQMEAGNTNPRLIKELNDLYKSLYEIDNAYLLIKKK